MAKPAPPAPDKIEYESLDNLFLDAKNPRLGRERVAKGLTQPEVLELMEAWSLEELATSFCASGFWPQEALVVVRENVGNKERLVVVEGNRRLAALKMLQKAVTKPDSVPSHWNEIVKDVPQARLRDLQDHIPYMTMPSRQKVKAYLGFRHVTGIKEWHPAEKAQFIAELIDNDKLSYEEVRRQIGSKLPTVRQNYITYRLLLEMEENSEKVDVSKVEERFSVLYLSLKTEGARKYLNITIDGDPKTAAKPVPKSHIRQLENFARWLFGDSKYQPLFTDSRKVDDFGRILLSRKTVEYLERTEKPSFEVAKRMAGVSESEVATHIETAADEAEEGLRAAHNHKTSDRVRDAVRRLVGDALQLARIFPSIEAYVKKEIEGSTETA